MDQETLLTNSEMTYLVVGIMVGVGLLSLPNSMVKYAAQDGWVSVLIGSLYPLYIIFIASYIMKKYPEKSVLQVSRSVFGNVVGRILNLFFLIQFAIYPITVVTGYINVMKVHAVPFLNNYKIAIISIGLGGYITYKGLKVFARINKLVYYVSIILISLSVFTLRRGNYMNLMPVFGSGWGNILKNSLLSSYTYAGIEIILIVYPHMKNKGEFSKCVLKGLGLTVLIYFWVTFITIYYLGAEVIVKNNWSYVLVNESFKLPALNNFRYIFIFLWSVVIFRGIAKSYLALVLSLSNELKKTSQSKLVLIIFPIYVLGTNIYSNETLRRHMLDIIAPKIAMTNILYVTIIGLGVLYKRRTTWF